MFRDVETTLKIVKFVRKINLLVHTLKQHFRRQTHNFNPGQNLFRHWWDHSI